MGVNQSGSEVSAAEVRAECDRILASEGFARSVRQREFLEYIVNAALENRADALKEFTLAVDVFGKDESFDPGADSIVRVEASRLRSKLIEYYAGQGQNDRVRIGIPKGHYVPDFRLVETLAVDRRSSTIWPLWAGAAIAATAVLVIYAGFLRPLPDSELAPPAPIVPMASSVAVLPLRDWSPLQEEYFSDAATDALISSLASVRPLRVTSFASIMKYKDTESSMPEIGRALGVAYVVEGSVLRDSELVKISARLIDAQSDAQIWSGTFDGPASDLPSVENEMAAALAAKISDEVVFASRARSDGPNPAAHEAYMKGRYFYNQFTADGYIRAMEFFQEAIRIEPGYAEAYSGLASCHCLLAGHGLELVSPVISIPQARAHAMKALSLDDKLAEPVAFLGIIEFKYEWNPEKAEAQLAEAIALNPSLYHAYVWHSQILEAMGRHDEAVIRARYAKQLNPLSLAASLNLGWQMYQAENYVEAAAEIDSLIDFDPHFWGAHWVKGYLYRRHRMYEKAIKEFEIAVDLEGGHSLPLSALGYTYAVAGRTEDAHQIIADLEAMAVNNFVSPYHIAIVYAGLNEPDRMFDQLERAYQVRARSLAWMQVADELKPFHNDSRFQDLLKRIGVVQVENSDLQASGSL